jgi:hypothetical protein
MDNSIERNDKSSNQEFAERSKEATDLRKSFYDAVNCGKLDFSLMEKLFEDVLNFEVELKGNGFVPRDYYLWHILNGSSPEVTIAFDTPDGSIEKFMRRNLKLPE